MEPVQRYRLQLQLVEPERAKNGLPARYKFLKLVDLFDIEFFIGIRSAIHLQTPDEANCNVQYTPAYYDMKTMTYVITGMNAYDNNNEYCGVVCKNSQDYFDYLD